VTGASSVGTVAEPDGEPRGAVALLAGCVMDAWFAPVHVATIELLRRAGYRVEVPPAQTCCGALAAHDGAVAETQALAARNVAAFEGFDLVVSDAAGCTAHLKELHHWADGGGELASRVRDVTELVAELIEDGSLPTLDQQLGEVAVQDPCHLRHAQRIVTAPRRILSASGYTPVEIDPVGMCCGAAGVYMVLHPETSDLLGLQKADQVRAAGPTLVASANPGCEMQLRSHLGPDFRVAHPVELYHEALLAG
jgi:glycolate oxidase iron-sulfur subunit